MSRRLDDIAAHGNRGHFFRDVSMIWCADGFSLSVIAGGGTYCVPRPALCMHLEGHEYVHEPDSIWTYEKHDYPGPYTAVEVGFPSERPEPWDVWKDYADEPDKPTDTVYGVVPVYMVQALIDAHGGEVES